MRRCTILLTDLVSSRLPALQLVVEALFLEATVQLVATTGGAPVLGPRQGQELEHVVFEWILKGETDYANDPYPQLHATRNRVRGRGHRGDRKGGRRAGLGFRLGRGFLGSGAQVEPAC